jgi:DNA modification methylase
MYIGHMVLICRQIKRVLRPDGTFWLNIGDSYSGSGGAGGDYGPGGIREGQPKYKGRKVFNLQDGDLIMVPARLALALQADGWIVRNDDIWAKSPMPEPRKGWRWEQSPCSCVREKREAHIREQMEEQGVDRHRVYDKAGTKYDPDPDCPKCNGVGRYGPHEFRPESWRRTRSHEFVFQLVREMNYYSDHFQVATPSGANPLTVMMPDRTNYSGKHFAVFPPDLIAPMIRASVPKKACVLCGKPWAPVVDDKAVTGYRPTCTCSVETARHPDPRPGWVLDPFMGSGTTGMVAREFGVNFIGCDIAFEYLDEQAKIRTKTGQPSKAMKGLPLFDE